MTIEVTAASPAADDPENEAAALADAEASTDANAAASSDADEKDAKEPVDLLSVVKSAVEPVASAADTSAVTGEGEAQPGEAKDKPAEGEAEASAEADADAKLPFHNHPRWKEVVAERNEFRDDAGRMRNIDGFMQTHGLTGDEVTEGFDIMAKLKSGDPVRLAEAREYFATRLEALDGLLGETLPEDLRERVEAGLVDEETAQELAKTRAAAKLLETRAETRDAATSEAQAARERVTVAQSMATAVEDWEKRQKQTDPDYARKAELVETTCRAIVQRTGKAPQTPEEAVQLVESALGQVNKQFKALLPKPKPVNPSPRGQSNPTVAEPKTLREAIAAAARG